MSGGAAAHAFSRDGFVVARGILDPAADLAPLTRAYETLIDALLPAFDCVCTASADVGERLATLIGASGGEALHHLAPVLSVFSPTFAPRGDLPAAQLPELFALMRRERLLDAIEPLVGPEISASPIYHLNMKLGRRHLALAEAVAAGRRRPSPSRVLPYYGVEVGRTPWHMDAIAGLRDSHDSRIVVAWIPLTPADTRRGSLLVVPGSHRLAVQAGPFMEDLTSSAVAVDAAPGDVVLMDNKLVHAATENLTDAEMRWACNVRYHPTGEPNGRPYLPGFVARSRAMPSRELRDAGLWQAMWAAALENLGRAELPVPSVASTTRTQAEAITRRWRATAPDHASWLRLRSHPTRGPLAAATRRFGRALRRAAGSLSSS